MARGRTIRWRARDAEPQRLLAALTKRQQVPLVFTVDQVRHLSAVVSDDRRCAAAAFWSRRAWTEYAAVAALNQTAALCLARDLSFDEQQLLPRVVIDEMRHTTWSMMLAEGLGAYSASVPKAFPYDADPAQPNADTLEAHVVLPEFHATDHTALFQGGTMIVTTNRIPVAEGYEIDFEDRFKNRVHLVDQAPGFIRNEVHRPKPMRFDHESGGFVEDSAAQGFYEVKTWWRSMEDFVVWTRGPAFAEAHKNSPPKEMFAGSSKLEVHEVFLSTDLDVTQ